MNSRRTRRDFIQGMAGGVAALALGRHVAWAAEPGAAPAAGKRTYSISLAAWSLHRTIGVGEGKTPMLDFPKIARQEFDIEAIELVNHMLASDEKAYLDQFAKAAADNNVKILLTMVDAQGDIGSTSENMRNRAVENHKKWIDITADFGGHCIRMNWKGNAKDVMEKPEELTAFIDRSVPGFQALCEYADKKNLGVVIENHWGPSSYPDAMERLMKGVNHPRMGTLPDFGNFPEDVDMYDAVDRLMKFAQAVSAKCYDFDPATGEETKIDFGRMIEIVHDKHGYHGYIGIEYEGGNLPEYDGIGAAKKLLEKLRG